MMRIVLFSLMAFLFFSCGSSQKVAPSAIGMVPLANYFVRNTVDLPQDYNHKVLVNQADFDAYAGIAATMGANTVQKPDFNGQVVVAVAAKPATLWQDISFEKATLAGKQMNVYYKAVKGEEKSFVTTSVALAAVPKSKDVTTVNFYRGDSLVQKVTVKIQ